MNIINRALRRAAALACLLTLAAGFSANAFAYTNTVIYSGQGLIADGFGGYDLNLEICGVANGADVDGPYLLWVLTATGANNANITGPWGGPVSMTKTGAGTFKYISGWYDPTTLPGNVIATYDGRARNAQLTISHGCRPFTHGAWCSPGFWLGATDAAWTLTGYSHNDLFNSTVVPLFYDTALVDNPTLYTVLSTSGGTYKGPGLPPYGLNAFNATGAFLTDNIPGFDFDPAFAGGDDSQTCPIDHFGNLK
jgi:hypothetical protein